MQLAFRGFPVEVAKHESSEWMSGGVGAYGMCFHDALDLFKRQESEHLEISSYIRV